MDHRHCLFSLLLLPLLLVSVTAVQDPKNSCVYTVYVRTGSGIKAGTDSHISLTLGDADGRKFTVSDLETQWGLMEQGHDYYERGNLDIFSGRAPCLAAPLCHLNLTSDGNGAHHGWYCEYAEVTSTGPHVPCSQTLFYVRQWLANDAPPYELSAVVDGCAKAVMAEEKKRSLVIGRDEDAAGAAATAM